MVLGRDLSKKSSVTYWLCKCDCGNEKILSVAKSSLTSGNTTSCGCARIGNIRHKNKFDLSGEYGVGWATNTNNKFYFDKEDFDIIKDYCWWEKDGYAVTQRERVTIRMHRLIMGVTDRNIQVDHIYHNTMDNRKSQMRLVTNMQNSWNKQSRGVYYSNEKNKYVGNITYNGKKYFKYFDNEKDAQEWRKIKEQELYKEYAYKEKEPCG